MPEPEGTNTATTTTARNRHRTHRDNAGQESRSPRPSPIPFSGQLRESSDSLEGNSPQWPARVGYSRNHYHHCCSNKGDTAVRHRPLLRIPHTDRSRLGPHKSFLSRDTPTDKPGRAEVSHPDETTQRLRADRSRMGPSNKPDRAERSPTKETVVQLTPLAPRFPGR
jgi:hypothetical protein